jgi:hypothetical protein
MSWFCLLHCLFALNNNILSLLVRRSLSATTTENQIDCCISSFSQQSNQNCLSFGSWSAIFLVHNMNKAALIACLCILAVCVVVEAKIRPSKPSESDIFWGKLNQKFDPSRFNTSAPQLVSIQRSEVLRRAKEWVDKKIPYCQCNGPEECCGHCPHCGSFRCDCSGYVWCFDCFVCRRY